MKNYIIVVQYDYITLFSVKVCTNLCLSFSFSFFFRKNKMFHKTFEKLHEQGCWPHTGQWAARQHAHSAQKMLSWCHLFTCGSKLSNVIYRTLFQTLFFFLFSSRKSFQNICICVCIHIYLQNLSFKRSIQEHVLKVFSLQILFTNSFQNTSWTFLFVFVFVFFFEK